MATIEFIEKEPYSINTLWANEQYYPCYMVKDGAEFFLWNRSEPLDRFEKEDIERRKQQLIDNSGAYFKFYDHSSHNSPIDFLDWLSAKKLTLRDNCTAKTSADETYFDFQGNLNECSCAFSYRIYDKNIVKEVWKKMIYRTADRIYLDKKQLERLYDVFLFEDDEEIETAWFEPSGQLCVDYDSPSGGAIYIFKPERNSEEDKEKLDYILVGEDTRCTSNQGGQNE